MRQFVQIKRLSTYDVVVNVVIMGIIEKHVNDQSHYVLEMNIVVSILFRAISTSKNFLTSSSSLILIILS